MGGGITPLNRMIAASLFAADTVDVEYAAAVSAATFNPAAFESTPSTLVADSIQQLATRRIRLTFTDDVNLDTNLVYSGTTPGITTPQTINY